MALAYGDRVRDKRSFRSSFIVDEEKKEAATRLLNSLNPSHREKLAQVRKVGLCLTPLNFVYFLILQIKQMIEMYIKLAELEPSKDVSRAREIKIKNSISNIFSTREEEKGGQFCRSQEKYAVSENLNWCVLAFFPFVTISKDSSIGSSDNC